MISEGFQYVFGDTNWKRYTFAFTANKTVNYLDPVTGDNGARLEFRDVPRGEVVSLANIELVPMRPVGTILRTNISVNASSTPAYVPCPELAVNQAVCNQYVEFATGQPVVWPNNLPALGSEIIYTRDSSIVDSDSDGIADVQDACPGTPAGVAANSRGFGLGQ